MKTVANLATTLQLCINNVLSLVGTCARREVDHVGKEGVWHAAEELVGDA